MTATLSLTHAQIKQASRLAGNIRRDRLNLPDVRDGDYHDSNNDITLYIPAAEIRAKLEERIARDEAELAAMGVTLLPDPPPAAAPGPACPQQPRPYWLTA